MEGSSAALRTVQELGVAMTGGGVKACILDLGRSRGRRSEEEQRHLPTLYTYTVQHAVSM